MTDTQYLDFLYTRSLLTTLMSSANSEIYQESRRGLEECGLQLPATIGHFVGKTKLHLHDGVDAEINAELIGLHLRELASIFLNAVSKNPAPMHPAG